MPAQNAPCECVHFRHSQPDLCETQECAGDAFVYLYHTQTEKRAAFCAPCARDALNRRTWAALVPTFHIQEAERV